jgi:hypothetical protein
MVFDLDFDLNCKEVVFFYFWSVKHWNCKLEMGKKSFYFLKLTNSFFILFYLGMVLDLVFDLEHRNIVIEMYILVV